MKRFTKRLAGNNLTPNDVLWIVAAGILLVWGIKGLGVL